MQKDKKKFTRFLDEIIICILELLSIRVFSTHSGYLFFKDSSFKSFPSIYPLQVKKQSLNIKLTWQRYSYRRYIQLCLCKGSESCNNSNWEAHSSHSCVWSDTWSKVAVLLIWELKVKHNYYGKQIIRATYRKGIKYTSTSF